MTELTISAAPVSTSRRVRSITRLGVGLVAGVLAGLGLTMHDAVHLPALRSAALLQRAAWLDVAAAALLGLAFALVVELAARPAAWFARRLRLGRFVTRDRSAPRAPVIALHAAVPAALAGLAVVALALLVALLRLRAVQVPELAEALTVAAGVIAAGLGAVVFASLYALFAAVFRVLDARFTLPRPAAGALQAVVYAALPLSAVTLVVAGRLPDLGALTVATQLLAVASLWSLFRLLFVGPERRAPRLIRGLSVGAALIATLGFALGARLPHDKTLTTLETAGFTELSLGVLRRSSDLDFDGASSLFAGGDCAPLNRSISPRASEVRGNGVDEDCDGNDGVMAAIELEPRPQGPVFHDELDPALIGKRNIVWFITDAARADHMSALGYPKKTTPYLERFAKESLVFTNALSSSSTTMLSIPSMMTGIDPGRMTWVVDRKRPQPAEDELLMAERLKREGYRTAIISHRYFRDRLPGILRGFDEVMMPSKNAAESATEGAALSAKYIERSLMSKKPFFLVVYFGAAHMPYSRHVEGYPDFGPGSMGAYDSELAYADRHFGFILDVLKVDKRAWDKTIVLATADHGEEFGEHGGTSHSRTCYIESLHVPLLLRVPGVPAKRVDAPVTLTDIAPSLIELLGLPRADLQRLTGRSLLRTAERAEPEVQDRPRFCTLVRETSSGVAEHRRAVRVGPWTYYEDLTKGREASLFNRSSDPGEKAPLELTGEATTVASQLERLLHATMTGNAGKLFTE